MRKTILLVAAAGLLIAAFPPTHAAGAQTLSGTYLLGSPIDYEAADACADPVRDSVTSSCVPIPTGGGIRAGMAFTLTADDALGTVQQAQVCFYTPAGFHSCRGEAGTVPYEAARLSVSSIGGVQVTWSISFA